MLSILGLPLLKALSMQTNTPKPASPSPCVLSRFVAAMERVAPTQWAASWDNVGLLVGENDHVVRHVLCCIDYTSAVAQEATALGCDTVVAYHPPLFKPMKRLVPGSLIADAVRRGLAIYSPHTAFDVAAGGVNDVLADAMHLQHGAARRALRRAGGDSLPPELGLGRVADLRCAASLTTLATRLKAAAGVAQLLCVQPQGPKKDGTGTLISRVAVCAGAGGELLPEVLQSGAHMFVTGELRHHEALELAAAGVYALCTCHSNSERLSLHVMCTNLQSQLMDVRLTLSKADHDPFCFI